MLKQLSPLVLLIKKNEKKRKNGVGACECFKVDKRGKKRGTLLKKVFVKRAGL